MEKSRDGFHGFVHFHIQILLIEVQTKKPEISGVFFPKKPPVLKPLRIDWGFRSTPQKDLLPEGRVIDLERGKTLGGSSAINYNLWVHGAAADFYRWETQYGCEGWSYKEVLPHFQALERFSEGSEASEVSSTARGKEGLIGVAPLFPPLPEVEDFMKACESHADANRIKDYNAGYLAGVSPVQLSTGGTAGGRQDCFSTLVEPLLKHYPNLQVVSETFCRKVLLESDLQARGVELELRSGEVLRISCRKEVVLSAGALLTPQLLMLSGIGEEAHLKDRVLNKVGEMSQNLFCVVYIYIYTVGFQISPKLNLGPF